MDIDVLQLLVYGGPAAVLLGVVLIWYLPLKEKKHSETIHRIHNEDHAQLHKIIERNSARILQLARAVLIASLLVQGKTELEAELHAARILSNGDVK